MEINNNSKENVYIDKILFNGEELYDYPFLDHIYNLKCNEGSNYIKLDYYLKSKSKN